MPLDNLVVRPLLWSIVECATPFIVNTEELTILTIFLDTPLNNFFVKLSPFSIGECGSPAIANTEER